MKRFHLASLLLALLVLTAGISTADVPRLFSYQGMLTNLSGEPVPNGSYTVRFAIYAESTSVATVALWSEQHTVATAGGLFNVILGGTTPIAVDLFDGSPRYMGIKIGSDQELSPRTPIISVPYAMTAGSTLGGTMDCASCDGVFINAIGPETMTSTSDTTLRIFNEHTDARVALTTKLTTGISDSASAINAYAYGSGSGLVSGGSFEGACSGASKAYGIRARSLSGNNWSSTGVYGEAANPSNGNAYGGYFTTGAGGVGEHFGAYSVSYGNSSARSLAVVGDAVNYGSGSAYGGLFTAYSTDGTGKRTGVGAYSYADGDSTSYGVYARAYNLGGGLTYGGYFVADSSGSYSQLTGCYAAANGDDQTTVGVRASSTNNSYMQSCIAVTGAAVNSGGGNGTGGSFVGKANDGTGAGVAGFSYGSGGAQWNSIGVLGSASGSVTDESNAGLFENWADGATQYGVHATVEDLTTGNSSFGVYGKSSHAANGNSYGGYFLADSTGTGTSYGGRTVGLARGNASASGMASYAANRGTGTVYAGYFEAASYGTGTKYAVYGRSPTTGYAGYFDGDVRITDALTVVGTKSAAVRTDDHQYRLVYCQESPENWFEDFGEGALVNGRVHIELDPLFLQTVTIDNNNPMKVFIQLNDPDCNGTAVVRGTTGFDVVELQNGTGQASFSYRVVAKRRGYERERLELMPGLMPEDTEALTADDMNRLQDDDAREAAPRKLVSKSMKEQAEAETQENN